MTLLTKLTGLAVAAGLAFSLSGGTAAAQTLDEIRQRGEIVIGIPVDFPPFGLMSVGGEPEGYDIDVANILAEELGVDVTLVPAAGQNRIPYLLSGRVDMIVSALGITAERAERVDYSQGYAGIEIAIYGPPDIEIQSGEDLAGLVVGVVLGATQATAVTEIAPGSTTIRRFDDNASTNQALLTGQVQVIGASNAVISLLDNAAPGQFETKFVLSSQLQGAAVRPGSDELLNFVNEVLTEMKQDGRLNAIHEKWLEAPLPAFIAEADEETTAEIISGDAGAN